MALGATLAHGFMLKYEPASLLLVARGAGFIEGSIEWPPCRAENIPAMRVVTIHTLEQPLQNRMMVRQPQLGVNFLMAIQARTRLATRVVNHRGGGHAALSMQASGPMAGLAPSLTRRRTRNLESGVGAGSKHIGDGLMAISTDLVSNVASSLYLRRPDHGLLHRRPTACPKGNKQQAEHATVHGLEKLIHASFNS